jgi:hypothetical protein
MPGLSLELHRKVGLTVWRGGDEQGNSVGESERFDDGRKEVSDGSPIPSAWNDLTARYHEHCL